MTDVPPEIEKLRDEAWPSTTVDVKHVRLSSAEAAVLACEQRMMTHAAEVLARERDRTITAVTAMVRERTVREIVTELRAIASDFGNGECDHPAVMEAADLIEQRFSVKKEDS